MSNTITCDNGHFYPATMRKCPFCEREVAGGLKTDQTPTPIDENSDRTMPVKKNPPIQIKDENKDSTKLVTSTEKRAASTSDVDRTVIHRPNSTKGNQPEHNNQGRRRKLEGWLVSFTMDSSGVDFQLFEGKNTIGRSKDCDVKLISDSKISSQHALIVFRGSESIFTDEFSSNPSYIDDNLVALGDRIPLKDGARIKMGDHEFIFRKINA